MSTIQSLHRRMLLATAGLGTLGVVGGSGVLAVAGVASAGALAFASRDLHVAERSATRRWMVHGVTVILLVLALFFARTLQIDSVFIILMLGVANRALLRASSRDDLLIVGGATVLLTAATVVTSGLGFALLLVTAIPCAAAALWTSTMLAGAEHVAGDHARLLARRTPDGLAVVTAGALALTVVGFGVSTLLPRYRFTPFLAAGALARFSGSSDTMRLTNDGAPDRDEGDVVMHVVPLEGVDRGTLAGLYARLHALDEFDGRTWRARTGGHLQPRDSMDAAVTGKPKVRVSKAREGRVGVHTPVPLLGRSAPWAVSGPGIHYDVSGTMVVDGTPARTLEYVAGVDVPLSPPNVPVTFEARTASVVRFVPKSLDARVVALGRQLVEGAATDDERIARVLSHFSRGFSYTTSPIDGESDDPLVRFLFESKQGHCELYAGAVATLLRVAGLDSRVASGYYLGHWNDLGEFLTFSKGDAHAWVEVRPAGGAWRWVDATPEDLRGERDRGLLRRVRDWYDAASALWYANVVDFDAQRQQAFYMRLSRALDARLRAWGDASGRAGGGLAGLWSGGGRQASAWAAVPLLAAAALALSWWALRRNSTPMLGRRLRAALGAGAPDDGVPLGVLAARATAPEAARAIEAYERLRFGPAAARPSQAEVVAAIAALERARSGRVVRQTR